MSFEGLKDDFELGTGAFAPDAVAKAVAATAAQNATTLAHAGQHNEKCRKCGGSGRFRSWSGRDVGPCHACKGRGETAFKTSSAQRASNRAKAADRRARAADAALEQFAAQHPAEWRWISAERASFDFAQSMYDAIAKYGDLTPNQLAACTRAVARQAERQAQKAAAAAQQARLQAAPVVSMDKLMATFAHARQSGLKNPKLRVAHLVISPAKAESTNAGYLYVKTGETYLGKISPEGRFLRSRECDDAAEAQLLAIAADPLAAAVAHGKKTGICSCCGAELTNALSIELGIGPICRSKWGLG